MQRAKNDSQSSVDVAEAWAAIERRDGEFDGRFVYAVRTSGVYCRPSCPSRRPLRVNVAFYATGREAEIAGFRACRRCHGAPKQAAQR